MNVYVRVARKEVWASVIFLVAKFLNIKLQQKRHISARKGNIFGEEKLSVMGLDGQLDKEIR